MCTGFVQGRVQLLALKQVEHLGSLTEVLAQIAYPALYVNEFCNY